MDSAARAASQWKEVSARTPCSICGHASWCSVNWDGSVRICRRMDDGTGKRKVDKAGGEYWVYQESDLFSDSGTRRPPPPPPEPEPPRASEAGLYRAYREILIRLPLEDLHLEKLRARGLPDREIEARKYRTYPPRGRGFIASEVARELGADACAQVPGFYRERQRGREYWGLAGPPGLLIPVRSPSGMIIALKIRVDEPMPEGPKYLYLSSTKHGGPGPGAQVHVPLGVKPAEVIRLTEGELKADIATVLSGIGTISIPGVSNWRLALPVMHQLQAKRVRLAFDADSGKNPVVARALAETAKHITLEGFDLEVETWPTSTE